MWKFFRNLDTGEIFHIDTTVTSLTGNYEEIDASVITTARSTIRSKLLALGLTADELTALLGPTYINTP